MQVRSSLAISFSEFDAGFKNILPLAMYCTKETVLLCGICPQNVCFSYASVRIWQCIAVLC